MLYPDPMPMGFSSVAIAVMVLILVLFAVVFIQIRKVLITNPVSGVASLIVSGLYELWETFPSLIL